MPGAVKQKKVIIVAGPTAVGKTAVAIQLAKFFNTEIISADSRQCFKELNIGVARPSPEELAAVPHHFIASHSILEEMNAALFEKYALQKAENLFQLYDTLIMAGGTGLYIKAFCEGLDAMPAIDKAIRQKIIENYMAEGLQWLEQEIKLKDPVFYNEGEMQNPQRMIRALEIIESTGRPIRSFRNNEKKKRNFSIIKMGLELPKEKLQQQINNRVDSMLQNGLTGEVKGLQQFRNLNALQTVGYKEIFEYLDETITLKAATDQIKTNTRQYAKRQMTWFKKDASFVWFTPVQQQLMLEFIKAN